MKSFRNIVSSKKDKFVKNLNYKIKNGKIVSWKDFKKLKKFSKSETKLDDDKMNSFQNFYANLYCDHHASVDTATKDTLLEEAINMASSSSNPSEILNDPFTIEELNNAINSLKNGKASSFDMISNEIIKSFSACTRVLLLKLFNLCLSSGTYFWGRSVITPIHKKGSYSNPDNYRAIAVCSCIGKLLSTMLLDRLIIHRNLTYPDPSNQCGFTKGCQCNDHILTLLTIMEKYKLHKKKVYAVFIDLRKAFDLVCRQALLYKLASYQVDGGYFKLIQDMYSTSSGHIKLNGRICDPFDIRKGTEQGHPLSPELFKAYFKELSDLLNSSDTNNPLLSNVRITHLAWADDVVILALDRASLDKQLQIIEDYCRKWGLEINVAKTKFMIINGRRSNTQPPDTGPRINGDELEQVSSYCYLGIIISSNGSLSHAIKSLSQKGLGALFSLRRTIDRRFIDPKNLNSLFHSLISPIITYGCQVWLPVSSIIRSLSCTSSSTSSSTASSSSDDKILSLFSGQSYEKVYLRHLKYLLGINRRSSNAAAWGETGSYPLIINCLGRCVQYFHRTINLDDKHFAKAAVKEQINSSLSWFKGIKTLIDSFDNEISPSDYEMNSSPFLNALVMADLSSSSNIITSLKAIFQNSWKGTLAKSSKLSFYNSVKDTFAWESYLDAGIVSSFNERRSTSQIRCSSHKLNIETGRYNNISRQERLCDFCLSSGSNINPVEVESEDHVLHHCPQGAATRSSFNQRINVIRSTSSNIPNFNIAETFPSNLQVISLDPVTVKKLIRTSCRHLHKIYHKILKFKKDLQSSSNGSSAISASRLSSNFPT